MPSTPLPDSDSVAYAGVRGQADLLRERRLTSVELVETLLARIDAHDGRLNAFRVVTRERALAEAREADEQRAAGDNRPLLGVPVAVKDNVALAGEHTMLGTGDALRRAVVDGPTVTALRAVGLVVIGKTHLPELALWPTTESATHGPTRNPWDLSATTGGSSGGAAAAVAAGLVPFAHATDSGGSIRIPAACCGLVGLKPSPGLLPVEPRGHAHGLTVAGVLTRTVEDTAVVYDALGLRRPGTTPDGSWLHAVQSPPRGLRIGWTDRAPVPVRLHHHVRAALHSTLDLLRASGHVVERVDPPYGAVAAGFFPRFFRWAHDDLNALGDPRKTERRTRAAAHIGGLQGRRSVALAHRIGESSARRIAQALADFDLLVQPLLATPPVAADALAGKGLVRSLAACSAFMPFAPPWNVVGAPAMSVPAGRTPAGLPLAVQLVGRVGDERTLLSVAAQLEATRGWACHTPDLG